MAKSRRDKLRLGIEAIHAINEAIAIRQNQQLDDLQLRVAKLYVLAVYVLVSKESPGSNATVREAIDWVEQIREPVARSGSSRLQCHWNYNAALILNETGEYAKAIEHATAARNLAKEKIEPSERIRHLALIAYVVIKSNLELGPNKSKSENLATIAQLERDLKSIAQPTPPIARRQQSYLLELKRIKASMQ